MSRAGNRPSCCRRRIVALTLRHARYPKITKGAARSDDRWSSLNLNIVTNAPLQMRKAAS